MEQHLRQRTDSLLPQRQLPHPPGHPCRERAGQQADLQHRPLRPVRPASAAPLAVQPPEGGWVLRPAPSTGEQAGTCGVRGSPSRSGLHKIRRSGLTRAAAQVRGVHCSGGSGRLPRQGAPASGGSAALPARPCAGCSADVPARAVPLSCHGSHAPARTLTRAGRRADRAGHVWAPEPHTWLCCPAPHPLRGRRAALHRHRPGQRALLLHPAPGSVSAAAAVRAFELLLPARPPARGSRWDRQLRWWAARVQGGPRIHFNIEDHLSRSTGVVNQPFQARPVCAPGLALLTGSSRMPPSCIQTAHRGPTLTAAGRCATALLPQAAECRGAAGGDGHVRARLRGAPALGQGRLALPVPLL